jgi:chromosomal replication initiation ATPase DnaA
MSLSTEVAAERRMAIVSAIHAIRSSRQVRESPRHLAHHQFTDYTAKELMKLTAEVTKLAARDIFGKPQFRNHVAARHLAAWLMHRYTALPYKRIITHIGASDCKTVTEAVTRIRAVIERNESAMPPDDACPTEWACAIWEVWGFANYLGRK